MKENYEDLMLSLTKEAEEKEKKEKNITINKIHNEQNKGDDFYGENFTFTEARVKFSQAVLNTFVPNGKTMQIRINTKLYIDKVSEKYIVRIPAGTDKWIIFRNKKPYFSIIMEEKNEYIYEIGEDDLIKININENVSTAISGTLRENKDKDFNVKFSLDYKNSLEFLKDLLSPGTSKRNNIIESFNNSSTIFEEYVLKIANELNIRLHKCKINGKSGMIGDFENIDMKVLTARQEVCIYKDKQKICEIYPCSHQRRLCVNDKLIYKNLEFTPHFHKDETIPYYYSANPNDDDLFEYIRNI